MQSTFNSTALLRPGLAGWRWTTASQYVKTFGLSLTITILTAAVALLPEAAALLQFDRSAIATGEFWRIVTGHCVHWNADHLFWDLTMFSLLGAICERRNQPRFAVVLLLATLAIPCSIGVLQPRFETYRGLSGLDSALFTLLAASLLEDKVREKHWPWVIGISLLLFGFAAKILFETISGTTVFVDSAAASFEPVPLAHIIGALAGLSPACLDLIRHAGKNYTSGTASR